MKRQTLLIAALLLLALTVAAQKKYTVYGVGFYNLENLFDTCHDEGKNDYDFLPNGTYKWDKLRYERKLHNMAYALADMGTDMLPIGCAIIGVSEVENSRALDDLVAQPELAKRGYKFVHIEGPDRRGVDCAMLYNPSLFTFREAHLVPYVPELEADSTFKTRGYLTVTGMLADEMVTVIVCHWPSRFSGSFYRETAGRQKARVKIPSWAANDGSTLGGRSSMEEREPSAIKAVGTSSTRSCCRPICSTARAPRITASSPT